jgi:hypothetical protein
MVNPVGLADGDGEDLDMDAGRTRWSRPIVLTGSLILALAGLAGCAASPDRELAVTLSSGEECVAQWRVEHLVANPGAAAEVAKDALADATIPGADLARWEESLRSEYVAEFGQPSATKDAEFERLAAVEVVREQVREALTAAGIPDSPTPPVEVYGSIDCG